MSAMKCQWRICERNSYNQKAYHRRNLRKQISAAKESWREKRLAIWRSWLAGSDWPKAWRTENGGSYRHLAWQLIWQPMAAAASIMRRKCMRGQRSPRLNA